MNRKPVDPASFATIVELIDGAEEKLVRDGYCADEEAGDYVTLRYIYWAAGMIAGATVYLASDERMGAKFFLTELPGARRKLRSARRIRSCAELLSTQPHRFFPNFDEILRSLFHAHLRSTDNPMALQINGVTLMAAAALPEYRAEIRREIRRRGGEGKLLVRDEDLSHRLNVTKRVDLLKHSWPVLA